MTNEFTLESNYYMHKLMPTPEGLGRDHGFRNNNDPDSCFFNSSHYSYMFEDHLLPISMIIEIGF